MSSVYISRRGVTIKPFSVGDYRSSEVVGQSLMFAAMTRGSNHTVVITRTGFERSCCELCQEQKARSENICYFSHSRPKEGNQTKSPETRTRVKFCFKDRVKMEQREPTVDPAAEVTEGRLRELASKWFIDTQLPLIVNNGLFPSWFLGFISRKDAEDLLRDKELGSFLIRLSDKAIGYILSYKGRDRCRHFVISQNKGRFTVSGDTERHDTMLDLIEHYKAKPIEPFGEYLTFPCYADLYEDPYDIIQVKPKEQPAAPRRAAKKAHKQQINSATEDHPVQSPRSNKTQEEVPPLPRRTRHVESPSVIDTDGVLYAHLMKQTHKDTPRVQNSKDKSPSLSHGKGERAITKEQINGRWSPPSDPESLYSELDGVLDGKCMSLPLLDSSSDGEQCYRLSAPPDTHPRLSSRPGRQAAGFMSQSNSSHSLDALSDQSVYHLAGSPSPIPASSTEQLDNSLYAEVSIEAPVIDNDGTYEILPNQKQSTKPKGNSNTYEPVEETKHKYNHGPWGIKNDKWKWLFPDTKRK